MNTPIIISGAPRSGTTWLHNSLISAGFANGRLADDLVVGNHLLATDENRFIHLLLNKMNLYPQRWSSPIALKSLIHLLRHIHAKEKRFFLESPYYLLFLNELLEVVPNAKFVFILRDPIAVALSMEKHWYLANILGGTLDEFWEFAVEKDLADKELLEYVSKNYSSMDMICRGLFKWHIFTRQIFSNSALEKNQFIVNYDNFSAEAQNLARFIGYDLTSVANSYRRSKPKEIALTKETEEFVRIVIQKTIPKAHFSATSGWAISAI